MNNSIKNNFIWLYTSLKNIDNKICINRVNKKINSFKLYLIFIYCNKQNNMYVTSNSATYFNYINIINQFNFICRENADTISIHSYYKNILHNIY